MISDLDFTCPKCKCKKCERTDILDFGNEVLVVCKCLKCGTEKVIHYLVSLGKQGK